MGIPSAGGSLLKAIVLFALAVGAFGYAQKTATVERTILSRGVETRKPIDPYDPTYREEQKQARLKATPIYILSALLALGGLGYVRRTMRIRRRSKLRYPYDFTD